jgi:uncharacterized RDD family membrane protein YckC
MSTTPPEQPTTPQQRPGGPNVNFNLNALMPTPGNAELLVFVLIEIFLAILLLDDAWNVEDWAFGTIVLGAAYLLSRGIAKASRVLER